ncbi:MAG TPA: hypothetical protein DCM38_05640 [Gammaproteobacteria bacterium]|nr:hypothetical protein [Gammaproteobacteria bacterium]
MAHKTQKDKEIMLLTDNIPSDYAAKLCFIVTGNHLVDILITNEHLDQLVDNLQAFKQQVSTE